LLTNWQVVCRPIPHLARTRNPITHGKKTRNIQVWRFGTGLALSLSKFANGCSTPGNAHQMGMSRQGCSRSVAVRAGAVVVLLAMGATQVAAQDFVGGTTPDRRPVGAPSIKAFERTPDWLARARLGIAEPYPASLKFLEDQGGWFTPFTRPNMPGPYDLRGLHAARDAAAKARKSAP